MVKPAFALCALLVLSACGGDRGLRQLQAGEGPDEFGVIPVRPLVVPDVLSLPQPTPGGPNRMALCPRSTKASDSSSRTILRSIDG